MNQSHATLSSGLLLLSVLITACPKPPPSDVWTTGQPIAIDDARALDFVKDHRDRHRVGQALRGSARVVVEGPDFKLNRPQRIAIARPSRVRFEVLGLFDVLAAILVSDGEEYGFFDSSSGRVTRGLVTSDFLWEWAQLDLNAEEVVDLLLATPMPSPSMALAGVWVDADAGLTFVYTKTTCADPMSRGEGDECRGSLDDLDRGAEIYRFDARGLLREIRSVDPDWVIRYHAKFDDYANVEAGGTLSDETDRAGAHDARVVAMRPFPMRMTVHSPGVDAMARFEWKRVLLTAELPDPLFRIPQM